MDNPYNLQLHHWHLEPSSKCALRCPRCPRTEGQLPTYKLPTLKFTVRQKKIPEYLNKDLSLDFIKKLFTPELLRSEIKRITMCGNVGDPIYTKNYLEICKYIKTQNPNIHLVTITNGSYKKEEWWYKLAEILNERDSINFSIDGFDNESNNIYRVNSHWDSIIQGVEIMSQSSLAFVNWAMIVFRFNQDKIPEIQKYAQSLGIDGFQITKSTKFGSKYGEKYGGDNDELEPDKDWIAEDHRYEFSEVNLSGRVLDNKSYLQMNEQKSKEVQDQYRSKYITPICQIGSKGLYVNSLGQFFPCCWVGYPFKKLESTQREKTIKYSKSLFVRYKEEFSLHNHSLEEIITNPIWEKLLNSFETKEGSFVECEQKCLNCKIV